MFTSTQIHHLALPPYCGGYKTNEDRLNLAKIVFVLMVLVGGLMFVSFTGCEVDPPRVQPTPDLIPVAVDSLEVPPQEAPKTEEGPNVPSVSDSVLAPSPPPVPTGTSDGDSGLRDSLSPADTAPTPVVHVTRKVEVVNEAQIVDITDGVPEGFKLRRNDVLRFTDPPHADDGVRALAKRRFGYGGAYSGYGTGEVRFTVRKKGSLPRDVGRFCSKGLELGFKSPGEFFLKDGQQEKTRRAVRTDEQGTCLATYILGPFERREFPDAGPLTVVMEVVPRIRARDADFDAQVRLMFTPADGSGWCIFHIQKDGAMSGKCNTR